MNNSTVKSLFAVLVAVAGLCLVPQGLWAANVTLNSSDATGATSFNSNLHWDSGTAPTGGNAYFTTNYMLRTPTSAGSVLFLGDSLSIDAGGTLVYKLNGSYTTTFTNLYLNGGTILNGTDLASAPIWTIEAINGITANSGTTNYLDIGTTVSGRSRHIIVVSQISGLGNIICTNSSGAGNGGTIQFATNNFMSGRISVVGPNTVYLKLSDANAFSNATVTVDVANRIQFDSAVAASAFILGGLSGSSGFGLTNTAGSAIALSIGNNNGDATYSGIMSSIGSLTKVGSGTLTLSGANTYSGNTLVSAGTLVVSNNLALANSVFDTSGAGTLSMGTGITTPTFGGLTGSTALTLPATVTTLTLNVGTGQTLTYSGALDGGTSHAMTLTKSGSGSLTLSSANLYTGTTVINAGTLKIGNGTALGAGSATIGATGTLDLNGQTIANAITTISGGALITNSSASAATVSTAIGSSSVSQLNNFTVGTAGDIVLSDVFGDQSACTLTKTGTGTLTLGGSGANRVSGNPMRLIINGGTVVLAKTGTGTAVDSITMNSGTTLKMDPTHTTAGWAGWAGQANAGIILAGSTFDLNGTSGNNNRIQALTGTSGMVTNSSATAAAFTISARDAVVQSYGGSIVGNVAVNLQQSFSSGRINCWYGTNTYSGTTTISAGQLLVTASGASSNSTYVISLANGLIFTNDSVFVVGGLSGASNFGLTNYYTGTAIELRAGNNGSPTTYSGAMGGLGSLTKVGAGTLTLSSGSSTFSGGVTLNVGTLSVGANSTPTSGTVTSGPLGTGTLTLSGGTLTDVNSGTSYTNANNISVTASTTTAFDAYKDLYLNGNLTGSGNLTRDNASAGVAVKLGGDNSGYSGTFTVGNTTVNNYIRFTSTTAGSAAAKWVINNTTANGVQFEIPSSVITPFNFYFGSLTGSGKISTAAGSFSPALHTLVVGNLGSNDTFSGQISQSGGTIALTKVGTGTMTLSAVNTYSGPTTVSNGTLAVNGSIASATTVVSPAILAGTGSISNSVTLLAGSASISLSNNVAETLTITNGLTLNNGNIINLDLGSTASDMIHVSGGSVSVVSGMVTINIHPMSGFGPGTYTLISGGVSSTNGFSLSAVAPHGQSYTLVNSGADLQLVVSYTIPPTAFWKGVSDATWSNGANWSTNKDGSAMLNLIPGDYSAVTLTAAGAGPFLGTVLGADFVIDTLTFDNASAVGIGGVNSLTINNGVTVSNGAAAVTVSNVTTIALGNSQTWTHHGANALTVNGAISGGGKGLTLAGTGITFLNGTNTYSGGTVVSNGVLAINNTNSAGSGTLTLSGGTLSNTVAMGYTNAITVTTVSGLGVANNLALPGAINGSGSLTKTGAGTLTLSSASSTYSGGTTLNAGTVQVLNNSSLGTGGVTNSAGACVWLNANSLTVANNVVLNGTTTGGAIVSGNLNAGNVSTLSGQITLNANANVSSFWNDKTLTLSGKITGPGGLTFDRSTSLGNPVGGRFIVSNGANDYAGATAVNGASGGAQFGYSGNSILMLGVDNALPATTTLGLNYAALLLSGHNQTLSGLTNSNTSTTLPSTANPLSGASGVYADQVVNGNVTAVTLTINNAANNSFSGVLGGLGANENNYALVKGGTGTLTLSGTNTYSGTTTIGNGVLNVTGKLYTNSVTVLSGAALAGTGYIYGPVTLQAGAAAINLTNGIGGILTLTNGLTLGNGNVLNFDIGTSVNSDKINITGGVYSKNTSETVMVNIKKLSGYVAGTNDLLVAAGLTTTNGYVLGTTAPGGFVWWLSADPSGKLQLVSTNNCAVAAFWSGAADTNWDNLSNWATDISGTPASQAPGPISTVTFTTTNAANLNTVLDAGLAIDRLVVISNGLSAASSVAGAGTLTLQSGLLMSNGSSSFAISNPVTLGSSQIWSNTSAIGTVTVAGAIGGSGAGLQVGGTGKFQFTASNTYDGGTVVSNSATLLLGNATDTLPDGTPVMIAGGTLDVGGNSDNVGTVTLGSGTITGSSGTLVGSAYSVQSGTISATLGGSAAMTKTGAGTVSIARSNTYSGGTTVSAGTVVVQTNNALGSGIVTLNGGMISAPALFTLTNAIVAQSGTASTLQETFNTANGNDLYINGNITGSGNITLDFTGGAWFNGVRLGGDNSGFSGTFTIGGTGNARHKFMTATAGSSNAFWNWTTSATDCGSLTFGSGTIYFGAIAGVGKLWNNGGGSPVMEIGGLNTNSTWSGNIGQNNDNISVRKVGTGTLTFASGNNYVGLTDVQAGTLAYGINNAIADSSHVKISGGTLAMGSYNDTVAGVQLVSGAITGTGGTLTSVSNYILENGTVSANLAGSVAVNKTNTGTVALSGNNTYSGGTTNANGTLAINAAGALSTGPLVLSGGSLDNTSGSDVTVSTANYQVWAADVAFTGTTNLNLGTGTVQLPANRNVTVSASSLTVGGAITGAYALVKSGAGTLILSNSASSYLGSTTVSNGVLKLGVANALGPVSNILTVVAGTVDLNGNNIGVGALGTNATTGAILNNGAALATLTVGNSNATFSSLVTLSNGVSPLAVAKVGTGTWTIQNANTYGGGTMLNAGTLDVWNSSAFGTNTVTLAGVVLQNSSGSTVTIGNNIVVQSGTTSLRGVGASNGNGLTFTGNISGGGSLVMDSNASWFPYITLSGDNSGFTGTFTVNGNGQGRMSFASTNSGSAGAAWVLNNNADDCPVMGFTGTIKFGSLSGAGGWGMRSSGPVTFEVGALNSNTTFSGTLGGKYGMAAALTKVGSGTLTLSGVNTYPGATTVSNGTLEVNGSIAGSGTTVNPGGKLAGSGVINRFR